MTEERKATDILLSIEADVKEILGYVRNGDLKDKIILERLRLLTEASTVQGPKPDQFGYTWKEDTHTGEPFAVREQPKTPPVAPAKPSMFESTPLKDKIRKAMEEASNAQDDIQFTDLSAETTQSGKRRGTRVQTNAEKQISVQQRIVDSESKNIFMAKVEIFDESNTPVKQTKTNQAGKWFAQLLPGQYQVVLSKAGTATKPAISITYDVEITDQDSNCELQTRKVSV